MATEKLILANKKFSNNWWTITDNNGREISIGTVNKKSQAPENQKLAALLINAEIGSEVEVDIREWKNAESEIKLFGNDPKSAGFSGGTKSFTPKNQAREAALSAAQATGNALALQKDITLDKFKEFAEGVHAWIMLKSDSNK